MSRTEALMHIKDHLNDGPDLGVDRPVIDAICSMIFSLEDRLNHVQQVIDDARLEDAQ